MNKILLDLHNEFDSFYNELILYNKLFFEVSKFETIEQQYERSISTISNKLEKLSKNYLKNKDFLEAEEMRDYFEQEEIDNLVKSDITKLQSIVLQIYSNYLMTTDEDIKENCNIKQLFSLLKDIKYSFDTFQVPDVSL